jgi:hypothetical protein
MVPSISQYVHQHFRLRQFIGTPIKTAQCATPPEGNPSMAGRDTDDPARRIFKVPLALTDPIIAQTSLD